jgi:hypothetical protein
MEGSTIIRWFCQFCIDCNGIEGGGEKTEIGEERFWECRLIRSPPKFFDLREIGKLKKNWRERIHWTPFTVPPTVPSLIKNY